MKKIKKIFFLLILLIALVFGSIYFVKNFFFISKASSSASTELSLIINNHSQNINQVWEKHPSPIVQDGGSIIYVPLELLAETFDVKTDYDSENQIAIITTKDKVIRFYGTEGKVRINRKITADIPSMVFYYSQPFVPVSHIREYLHMDSMFIEETNTVILTNLGEAKDYAEASKNKSRIRTDSRLLSQVITILNKGEKLQILGKEGKWLKVLTQKGQIGYIDGEAVDNLSTTKGLEITESIPVWQKETGKILLAWEHVHSKNPDTAQIGSMEGVNVVSPTWISLRDEGGSVSHKIDRNYIQWTKQQNYKVWALFNNQFNPDMTHVFLNDAAARETAVENVLRLIKDYDIDGINIDFENVYLKDKEKLVQFVRELVPVFHEYGLVVSMDVTVKSMTENWSLCYDRRALGEVLDYMAVMTYDEHWSSSPVSGSVASIGWVERGIRGILEEVPAEKLLLGIPFYTRIWTETPSEQGIKVSSRAVSMNTVNEILDRQNLQKQWNVSAGQYYVEYRTGEKTNKIWIEDSESIQLKTDLVKKYNLGGAAVWRRGFETEDIWEVLNKRLNQSK